MSDVVRELVIATGNPHKVAELSAILGADLARMGVCLVGLRELEARGLGPFVEPEETGESFEQNASIKALSYARQTGMVCVADDSGLEIDALGGRPGVISSHYFNEGRTDGAAAGMGRSERDQRNIERVLRELRGVEFERRTARFVCVMAVGGLSEESRGVGGVLAAGEPEFAQGGAGPLLGESGQVGPRKLFRGTFEGRIGFPGQECAPGRAEHRIPRGENGFGYDPIFLVSPEHARTSAELDPGEKNRLSHRARAAGMMGEWLRSGGAASPW